MDVKDIEDYIKILQAEVRMLRKQIMAVEARMKILEQKLVSYEHSGR